ncbi:MAG: UbiX family flavin prenyltransferase [Deltaproteobacteria bacterium]|nr:UbiX family flavin prenyltransferase [Deltaproteobacteria bacterium]
MKNIIVAICGASGSIYAVNLLKILLAQPVRVHLMVSEAGRRVMAHEVPGFADDMAGLLTEQGAIFHEDACLRLYLPDDHGAGPASGSFAHDGMAVIPCSMNTLASIANGITANLIHRAADVTLKEGRKLLLCIRETPLSLIHIDNMARAARSGAVIMPLCPGFYFKPRTMDDLGRAMAERAAVHLGVLSDSFSQWGEESFDV